MRLRSRWVVFCIGAIGLNVACGSSLAPRELLDARDAYAKAQNGPASKYALAELETAKQSLQEAEFAFRDGNEDELKDLSYVAERKAQLANASGELEEANRERAKALQDQKEARDAYQRSTERRLTKAQRELEDQRRQELAQKQKIAQTEAQLSAEKAARAAAEKKAAAALASLEQLAKVKEEKRGVVITLSGAVLFATGKYELLPIARNKLDEVAKALKDQGYKSIVVEGHTDSRGSESRNQQLSESRASSVRMHLVSRGIDASKTTSVGLGESRPIASNRTAEGRANNRRVEIIVQPER